MPVAKNRKFAEALGISTFLLNHNGFPLSVVSASARASWLASMRSEILFNTSNRFSTGVRDQRGKAFFAADTASTISFSLLSGMSPIDWPGAGSRFVLVVV